MQAKTTGIILHQVRHTDSSSIVSIYTREFGRVSYMIHGANKKRSTCRAALLQPLQVVEMDVNHHPKKEIQGIREIRIAVPFYHIPYDPVKNCIALFIAEVLHKSLRHSGNDEELYDFLELTVRELDSCERGVGNFHIVFMAGLAAKLGFAPDMTNVDNYSYFDLMGGVFENRKPKHAHFLEAEAANKFKQIMSLDYANLQTLPMNRNQRAEILCNFVDYFKLHLPDFNFLKSTEVLQNLWR